MPRKTETHAEDDPIAYGMERLDALDKTLEELRDAPKHRRAQVRVNGQTEVYRVRHALRQAKERLEFYEAPPAKKKINPEMAPAHRKRAARVADIITEALPPGTGFAILIFDIGRGDQNLSYLANVPRVDMLRIMGDFIRRHHDA